MANNAYVIPPVMPTVEEITRVAQAVVQAKFPQLTLTYHAVRDKEVSWDKCWLLRYAQDDYIGLVFYLEDYQKVVGPEPLNWFDEIPIEKLPAICFRHGHFEHRWMNWVEEEIREAVATQFQAQVVEDSEPDTFRAPQIERFDSYCEYIVRNRWSLFLGDESLRTHLINMVEIEKCKMPRELWHLLGDAETLLESHNATNH